MSEIQEGLQNGCCFMWWLATAFFLCAEMASGTFYLLTVALGCTFAGVAKLIGWPSSLQISIAAVVTLVAVGALRRSRFSGRRRRRASENRDVNQDIGARFHIPVWQAGMARVHYRGASWEVGLLPGEPVGAYCYEVRAVVGSRLMLAAVKD
jgi:membrane protein implicated in regulation of membrane protease activity